MARSGQSSLADIDDQHAIWSYYKNSAIEKRAILLQIIPRFSLEFSEAAGYAAVEAEIVKKHVPESQIRTLIESISGWLIRLVAERIANGGDARVTWDEFDKEFVTHFTRARRLELIDFALTRPPSNAEIDVHMRLPVRPFYLQQMESVNSTDDELIDAVYDFLRAKTNRDHWIEDEIIDETIASDFEDKLRKFWANTKKKFSITHKKETKEDQGQLVLLECMERTETVGTQHPPSRTVAGTYHALANNLTLGWHADWEKKFKK